MHACIVSLNDQKQYAVSISFTLCKISISDLCSRHSHVSPAPSDNDGTPSVVTGYINNVPIRKRKEIMRNYCIVLYLQ